MNTVQTSFVSNHNRAPSGRVEPLALTFATASTRAPISLRLTVFVVMFPHGAQKLLGWFGGSGFESSMNYLSGTMGIPFMLGLGAILIEFFAPLLVLLGLATRPAAIALGIVMTTAMVMVQWPHGFFMNWSGQQAGEGIQFTLLLLGALGALVVEGAGQCSLDSRIAARLFHPTAPCDQ